MTYIIMCFSVLLLAILNSGKEITVIEWDF